jgi:threonine/homoserine/homoserine lactone efflux protein
VTTEQILPFLLFAVVAAISPGPSNIIVASAGANGGVLRGLPCLFGVGFGMGFMMFVVALGLGSLVLGHPTLLLALKWGGVLFLLWLAWKIATARHGKTASSNDVVGFWQAAAFQWVNPKSWLVTTSAVGAYLQAGSVSALAQAVWFGSLFVLASLPSCFVWLAFGATMQRFLQTEQAARRFNIVMGALLAGSILHLIR